MKLTSLQLDSFLGIKGSGGSATFTTAIPSDVAVFIGKNGCGKSILLEQLAHAAQGAVAPSLNQIRTSMDLFGNSFSATKLEIGFDFGRFSLSFQQPPLGLIQPGLNQTGQPTGIALYIPPSRDIGKPDLRMTKMDFPLRQRVSVFDSNLGTQFEQTMVSIGTRHVQASFHKLGVVPETQILERISAAYQVMFPDIDLVGAFGHQFLAKKNGVTFPISNLSHGEKQALILFSFVAKEPNLSNSILIIDEPDIGLSRELRKKLVPSLRAINASLQILLATHSAEIIDSVDPSKIIPLSE